MEWSGTHRAPIHGLSVFPRPVQNPLPVWVAVGGTPQSVVRAATLGLPMALAIIGGEPERFKPMVDLYREAAKRAGHDPATLPVSINSHGYIADSSQAGGGRGVSAVPRRHGAHRPRARLVAAHAREVRSGAIEARRAAGRRSAGSDRQDPLRARAVRAPALSDADERRHHAARADHAFDRAVGRRRRARRAKSARRIHRRRTDRLRARQPRCARR